MVPEKEVKSGQDDSQDSKEALPSPKINEKHDQRISIEEALEIIKEVAAKNPH